MEGSGKALAEEKVEAEEEEEEEQEEVMADGKFLNAGKARWRSASWNSRSAPASPKEGQTSAALTSKDEECRAQPCLERQGSRARASLPPLQPLTIARRSLEDWPQAAADDMKVSDWSAGPATPGRVHAKTGRRETDLDLDSLHRASVEPADIQFRRDRFSFSDKECSRVANYHIYLGSDAVAKNRQTLKAHGITHVLNCVGFVCPEYFKKDFTYKTLWLRDSPGEDITSLLYDVFDYFEEVRDLGGCVFVHCCQGVSRSTSLVIAYMMWREGRSFEEAFQDVKQSRGVTNPNMGFACQLLQCQKRVHAAPMSPNSVLRMYRLAPHSPYDPLHLVPKAVNNPGAVALDSRGAFVIHVPLAIYVWIGHDCDPKMAQAARVAAAQVVRYERAQGQTHIVVEGAEDDKFWENLGKYAHVIDDTPFLNSKETNVSSLADHEKASKDQLDRVKNFGVGNRKVPSYTADFELYQRARQGGVVPPVPCTGAGVLAPTRIPAREDGWSVLRRKFLSGELFPGAEMNAVDASPSPTVSSSSPLFSPFSITTASSSSTGGGDSVSGSPLSHLSIQSPVGAWCGSPEPLQPGPGGNDWTLQPISSSHLSNQKSFPVNIQIRPPNLGPVSPAIILAKRGGAGHVELLVRTMSKSRVLPHGVVTNISDGLGKVGSGTVDIVSDVEMLDTDMSEDDTGTNAWVVRQGGESAEYEEKFT